MLSERALLISSPVFHQDGYTIKQKPCLVTTAFLSCSLNSPRTKASLFRSAIFETTLSGIFHFLSQVPYLGIIAHYLDFMTYFLLMLMSLLTGQNVRCLLEKIDTIQSPYGSKSSMLKRRNPSTCLFQAH